jgi:hypothetical protein
MITKPQAEHALAVIGKVLTAVMTFAYYAFVAVFRGPDYAAGLYRSDRAAREGVFCENRHRLVEFGIWECSACSHVWRGSGWHCPSRECKAPATAHLPCQELGCPFTVENPHRF